MLGGVSAGDVVEASGLAARSGGLGVFAREFVCFRPVHTVLVGREAPAAVVVLLPDESRVIKEHPLDDQPPLGEERPPRKNARGSSPR